MAAALTAPCLHKDAPDASAGALVTLLSSSDHSDIVTLNSRVHVEEEGGEEASDEDLYLGTPCSSQYTFTPAETGRSGALYSLRRNHEALP